MRRVTTALKDNWKFTRTQQSDALAETCDDSQRETISVPHDWAITGPFDMENDIDREVRGNVSGWNVMES